MGYSLEEKVRWLAITSRISVVFLQFLLNILIPDHDAGVFIKPSKNNGTGSFVDYAVHYCLEGLSRWDAQYFLHIAQYGYTYENTLAFFPMFPLAIRELSAFLTYVCNNVIGCFVYVNKLISFDNALLMSAVILNNFIFVKTVTVLFMLGTSVLKNEKLSFMSCVLFCFNPASIFFSAAYSESLYCFLSFYGMLQVERENFLLAGVLFGLSGATRSNGITNVGFLAYRYLKRRGNKKYSFLGDTALFSVCIIVSFLPFVLYQAYGYLRYCLPEKASLPEFIVAYGVENNFVFPGSNSSWCNNAIPMAYSYVQSHYWNVGFLRYYEIKQIPNFFLALPVFFIVFIGSFDYVSIHRTAVLYLGFRSGTGSSAVPIFAFPYVVHCCILSTFAALVIHIQVATRLLCSSSPIPYWFSAWFVARDVKETVHNLVSKKFPKKGKFYYSESSENKNSRWRTFLFSRDFQGAALWVKYYYLSYFFLGTLMFSNYLPWT
ncbi:UNVERIFIED_CONTAM: hypothetical protein PYX00_010504 [Menopon gallinae]|uniref:GPI mannosyltransferase 2 n=1 Tax=Menopon gallinae TaxID=328185 RepID=A0AAW2HFS3_9NEOP